MKKIVLSALAALTLGTVHASASDVKLYSDANGQVFTTPGEGRTALESKETPVFMKGVKLEFSGTHYFGYTVANPETTHADADASDTVSPTVAIGDDTAAYAGRSTGFEARRNYVQVKAFFNDKDYFRVTMDTTKELASKTSYANIYAKYAYLYLDEVLPFTGVEVGIVHRPWIDYEEHNAWHYRSFNKVMIEEKGTVTEAGVDLLNSADLGFNFKTKTEFFTSEVGMFNGEGYHADKAAANQENSGDLSLEWRLTGHILGDGKKVGKNDRTKATYAHISTYGLVSKNHKDDAVAIDDNNEYDRTFYGLHAVYNQPLFLLAAQYVSAEDKAQNAALGKGKEYDVWSINGEIRPIKDWTVVGRYDNYKIDEVAAVTGNTSVKADGDKIIAALAYKYSKNVSFIGSGKFINEENALGGDTGQSKDVYMLTTEVKW
ncbi:MAG TPA: hypothetical protein CFH84_05845 [Sulfurimonas sp. UBA12504]|nr:MAG: hypothetical protein A2019_01740 [Sulfurimonas sp. GWF2_37_8]DAB30109.1 MAG TPA: hypothetical protein CFH84_05845 [Sulfurimonas sp. UBA12504]